MKQKFTLVTFEIRDGEHAYYDHTIFKKDPNDLGYQGGGFATDTSESEIIKEAYGEDFECDYREVIVYSTQKITRAEVDTLQKLHVAFINY
tara:strand:+ start:174 stop:446 length:273 start_codon:yes stop_codon:yes gene_type:complete